MNRKSEELNLGLERYHELPELNGKYSYNYEYYVLKEKDFCMVNGDFEKKLEDLGWKSYSLEISRTLSTENSKVFILRVFDESWGASDCSKKVEKIYGIFPSIHYSKWYNSNLDMKGYSKKRISEIKSSIRKYEKEIKEMMKKIESYNNELNIYEYNINNS